MQDMGCNDREMYWYSEVYHIRLLLSLLLIILTYL